MNDNIPFLKLEQPCDEAVNWLAASLGQAGLSVVRTFDLQSARDAQVPCPCPHHGTAGCDCQMLVLLVYRASPVPITLIAHGYDRQTWFSIVNTPQQRANPQLEARIRSLVASQLSFINSEDNPQAI